MKQFYTLLFIVITTFGFGQEYKFNLLTRYNLQYKLGYEFKFKEVNRDRILYSNIEDSSYFLIINKTSAENKAYITDLRTNKIHFLQFKEIKSDNDVFFTFEYLKTENLVPFEVNKNVVVEFETIKEDSLHKTVKMTTYKNKKKKKIIGNQELVIRKYPTNMFPLFRYSCMHTLEYHREIDLKENGIVESSTSLLNVHFKTKLDYIKEVDLTLKIPIK